MLIGYARVSTDSQSVDMQIAELEKAGCERIFTETASGAQADRPQLAETLKFAREGDVIVVWKLDRLARTTKQLLDTVEMLDQQGVQLRSLTQPVDTTTPAGKLVYGVFAIIAEFERDLIIERTRAGLAQARKQGRIGGRPKKLDVNEITAAQAMLTSMPVKQVAERLGVSVSTLRRRVPKEAFQLRATS